MNDQQLLHEVKIGRLLIVGEFRGAAAEMTGYVDRKNGEKIEYVRAMILVECACRGNVDRAILYQRLPEIVETPEQAVFPYVKGRQYVFFLNSLKAENGQIFGYLADRLPELVAEEITESVVPAGAPQGAPGGMTP